MNNSVNIKHSHFFLTSHQDVDDIARPLKEYLDVTSLVYQINYSDGSEIRLSNQPTWLKHFYDQDYARLSSFEKHPDYYQPGCILWSGLRQHQPILNAAREFNIDHGVTLIQKIPNGVEYFFIGTTPDKSHVPNLLINNHEFVTRFTAYFKEQASSLIQQAEHHRVFIPNKYHLAASDELGIPTSDRIKQNALNKIINVKKMHVANKITLSAREMMCAKLVLQGKSARLIADDLSLSRRTVETHLSNLKIKLNCRTKSELISQLLSLKINLL